MLTTFRLLRTPRAACEDPAVTARIDGEMVSWIEELLGANKEMSDQDKETLEKWKLENPHPVLEARSSKKLSGKRAMLMNLDCWLLDRGDNPPAEEFMALRTELATQLDEDETVFWFSYLRQGLSNWIAAEMLSTRLMRRIARGQAGGTRPGVIDSQYVETWDRIRLLTRMLLVLDLLDPIVLPDETLTAGTGRPVWDRLHRRSAIVPPSYRSLASPRGIEMVRKAKVTDRFVVRSEWSCYLPGEIASIMNVLAGETFEHEVKHTDEQETTTTEDSERIEVHEQLEEDRTQTEISREIDRAISLEISAEGSADVSGQYGLTTFGASASTGLSASLAENTRQAASIAHDLVSRASARVESRVREQRVERRLTRLEDRTKHVITNGNPEHTIGIYRWVDRVDRYQVFRYSDRMVLEFQIPEPAEYVRYRLANPAQPNELAVPKPPAFDTLLTDIKEESYGCLLLKYHASNVPPPPEPVVGVTEVLSANTEQTPLDNRAETWMAPRIEKSKEVMIPKGYSADKLLIAGSASPFHANWRTEMYHKDPDGDLHDQTFVEGFHQITLVATAGGKKITEKKGGTKAENFSVQLEGTKLGYENRTAKRYGSTYLIFQDRSIDIKPGAQDKLSLGFQCAGAGSATVSFLITCNRTPQALAEWQNTVYDILFDAWRAWEQEWRTSQLQQVGPVLNGANATSPTRNKEIVAEELKRQAITWLLDDPDFAGLSAMIAAGNGQTWDRYDAVLALQDAPTIQFLEQAFEWGKMSYIFYPYFWARGTNWDLLADYSSNDPEFAKFLRSGSARLEVSVRPGFEEAVEYWLTYQLPFFGDKLPLPGDPMFVSVAQEIQDLSGYPDDGTPNERAWEQKIATPLIWLDPAPDLPNNPALRLGQPPYEPQYPLCS